MTNEMDYEAAWKALRAALAKCRAAYERECAVKGHDEACSAGISADDVEAFMDAQEGKEKVAEMTGERLYNSDGERPENQSVPVVEAQPDPTPEVAEAPPGEVLPESEFAKKHMGEPIPVAQDPNPRDINSQGRFAKDIAAESGEADAAEKGVRGTRARVIDDRDTTATKEAEGRPARQAGVNEEGRREKTADVKRKDGR